LASAVTAALTPAEVQAGWVALEAAPVFEHVRPLSDARKRFVREAQSNRRLMLGWDVFDREMRGVSPGHLMMLTGYSHSGKTLVALNILHANRTKRIALFTPDEPAPLVLTKLASMVFGIPARQLEEQVRDADHTALRMLDEVVEEFPNLLIFDRPLTPKLMRQSYTEACEHWGDVGDLAVIDYLDLVRAGESVVTKADAIKAFGTEHDVPLMVLHQTSRSAGTNGRPMRIDSGNFGGETWATFQLGIWRKRNAIVGELYELAQRTQDEWVRWRTEYLRAELPRHEYTLTVNLNKNKRPGGRLIEEGVDFELSLDTGHLRPLNGDLPEQLRRR
jgi:hypothetical protein